MGVFHPQVVHFAIALLMVGVIFRVLSLVGKPSFVGPAAAALLTLGTLAAVAAAVTGIEAHRPVEQMPGLRPVIVAHERWGERTRNVFIVVLLIEMIGLALRTSPRARAVRIASAVVGVAGLLSLYKAAEHGGAIVYRYAGGVGIRSGDPRDVQRLLLAGLYQQALADREAGRAADAAALMDVAKQRFPDNVEVQLAVAESVLRDRKDATAALEVLRGMPPPTGNRVLRIRHGMLTAYALETAGQHDGAVATLQQLLVAFPNDARVKQRLDALQRGAAK